MIVRILGDVHGNYGAMLKLMVPTAWNYCLQLGDLGFDYSFLDILAPESRAFSFIPGNHDNYDTCFDRPECLGNYGPVPFIPKSFFLRGGFSIDVAYRTPGLDWWDKEELSLAELDKAVEEYEKVKPDYMFAHECPLFLVDKITDGRVAKSFGFPEVVVTRTNLALDRMFKVHKPKYFFFGHYHRDVDMVIDGTRFICLTSDSNKNIKQTHFDLEI